MASYLGENRDLSLDVSVDFAISQKLAASSFFIYDEKGSKSSISDKDVTHFQAFAEMRRCSRSFSFMH